MIELLLGNCLESMKQLSDNSIDSIVTDPPYGLSFMGKKWDYDVPSIEIWKEALRILKPGGHLLSFGGTRTYHRLVMNIEDAGFEIRDCIQWLYGSGFPKSHNIKEGDYKGWGTALKPANEPICVARKPLEKGLTVAENVLKYGTGAINIDGSRVSSSDTQDDYKRVRTCKPETDSTFNGCSVIQSAPSQLGRWPANIILDEEAAMALDEQSIANGIHSAGKPRDVGTAKQTKTGENATSWDCGHSPNNGVRLDDGDKIGASRFFYVAKASKSERNKGLEGMEKKEPPGSKRSTPAEGRKSALGEARENFHPTVKPIKLMEYLIKLVTPPQGTVLDPFMGSGSTGVASKNLNRNFIGIEKDSEYFEIARKRIDNAN